MFTATLAVVGVIVSAAVWAFAAHSSTPTLIALVRFGARARRIAIVNALTGWTVRGWAWTISASRRSRTT